MQKNFFLQFHDVILIFIPISSPKAIPIHLGFRWESQFPWEFLFPCTPLAHRPCSYATAFEFSAPVHVCECVS